MPLVVGVHLDLVAGADRALVVSFYRDAELEAARMTLAPGDLTRELGALESSGTRVLLVAPRVHPTGDDADVADAVHAVMDPARAHRALELGAAQADEEFADIAAFWN